MARSMRTTPLFILTLFVASAAAGCFSNGNETALDDAGDVGTAGGNQTMPSAEEMYVVGTDVSLYPEAVYKMRPAAFEFQAGQTINLTFKNALGNRDPHSLVLEGYDVSIGPLQTGAAESVIFVADQTGTFAYYCDIDNHRELGMEGQLTIS